MRDVGQWRNGHLGRMRVGLLALAAASFLAAVSTQAHAAPVPVCKGQPAGTVCRPAAGPGAVPEVCDGTADSCPVNHLQPAGTVCRAAAGVCDVAETCSGTRGHCPAGVVKPCLSAKGGEYG